MSKIIAVLFVLIYIKGISQTYFPFPDTNAVWTVLGAQTTQHTIYAVKGDSVYNATVYKKYFTVTDTNLSNAQFTFHALVRQDLTSKRIYGIKKNTTTERVLYDFSLNVNDTLSVYSFDFPFTNDKHKIIVTHIDNVLVNSVSRKRFKVIGTQYLSQPCTPEYWIEGIGSLNGLFNSGTSDFCITDFNFPILLCEKENGILNYVHAPCNSCFASPCLGVGVKEQVNINDEIYLYPNPANEELNVSFNMQTNIDFNKIFIYNSLGQLIRQEGIDFKNNKASINTSSLQNGIYFLNLKGVNKQFVIAR